MSERFSVLTVAYDDFVRVDLSIIDGSSTQVLLTGLHTRDKEETNLHTPGNYSPIAKTWVPIPQKAIQEFFLRLTEHPFGATPGEKMVAVRITNVYEKD